MKMLDKHQGFTLIECLFVLLIMSIFLLCPILMIKEWREQLEVEMSLSEFERNLQRTHQSAIIELQDTNIYTQPKENTVQFSYVERGENVIIYQQIKEPLLLESNDNLQFASMTGNVDKLITFKFTDNKNKRTIKYAVQLGSGKINKHVE